MEFVLWAIFTMIALGLFISLVQFSFKRPFTIIAMMLAALIISPNGQYVWTAIGLITLSWLFTSRDGLIMIGAFIVGAFYGSRR